MARRSATPNPNPLDDRRSMLDTPEPVRVRRRITIVTEGRGNAWIKANHHGWEQDAMIVYARDCGGWRTLSPELWEWKS